MEIKTKPRILVIDDETRVCKAIKIFLERDGLDVYTANSVKESISLTEKIQFDLFIIDKNLPGDNGFVFMECLLETQPQVPFIMMTGDASIDSAILALKKGAYDYLRKPFKYEELASVVSHALAQKQLEDENRMITAMLDDSQRRYREMIDNSPDIIIMLDGTGCVSFVNNTFSYMLGYSFEEILGTPLINIVDEKYKEIVNSFLNLDGSNNEIEPLAGIAVEIICSQNCESDSKNLDIEIKKSDISFDSSSRGSDYSQKEICIVGRDIGLRKAFEQQMIYAQKMEAVALLAGGVAHNFNNLLMGIQGYTSVIKLALGTEHSCYNKLMSIEKSIAKGSNLISQLLNFARGGVSNIQAANLNFVIKEALELFSVNKKNIQIHLDLKKDLWNVNVDVCQLEQVFLNMFINAHHAMEKGGKIIVKTDNLRLNKLEADKVNLNPGSYIKISIKDTGHGIDEKHHKKIFDPFFSTKKRSKGTGLGLASAYGIVKKHNGTITVSSSPGNGALFTIFICVALDNSCVVAESCVQGKAQTKSMASPEPEHCKAADSFKDPGKSLEKSHHKTLSKEPCTVMCLQDPDSSTSKKSEQYEKKRNFDHRLPGDRRITALVIDDEPFVQQMTVGMLKEMCIDTITAYSGRDGIQKYMEDPDRIDLVILDMVMPGMGGFETFRYIRKLDPDARILIASAYKQENEVDRMVAQGGCSFLEKPYDADLFYDRISSLLGLEKRTYAAFAG
ncbi:MAG: response regulator [Desulfamplus sp.]|nr:response regulator [Desulfamplus sp.]